MFSTLLSLAAVVMPAVAAAQDAGANRQQLLTEHVGKYMNRENIGEGFGYAAAILGVGLTGLGVAALDDDRPLAATWIAGGGVSTAAFTTSLFLSRDARVSILQQTTFFNGGVVFLGIAVADDPGDFPRLSSAGYAAGAFGDFILQGINLLSRPTPLSRLRRHDQRLESGESVSDAELSEIERDFVANGDVISNQLIALPWCGGAVVGLVPAFSDEYSKDERTTSAIVGGLTGLNCLFRLVTSDPVRRYRKDLDASGLSLMAGAASIEARYVF